MSAGAVPNPQTPAAASPTQSATISMAALLPSLHRLDQLLAAAIKAADAAYGTKAASDPYRGLYVSGEDVQRLLGRVPGAPLLAPESGALPARPQVESPLTKLRAQFGLTDFDLDVILLALAPEIDVRYDRLYAYLQDDVTRRKPTVDLALNLLCDSKEARWNQRSRFLSSSPLMQHGLIHAVPDPAQTQPSLLAYFLKLDEPVVRVLMGQACLDARIAAFSEWKDAAAEGFSEAYATLTSLAAESDANGTPLCLYFQGPEGAGQAAALDSISHQLGRKVLAVDLAGIPAGAPELDKALASILREAQLLDSILYFEHVDSLRTPDRTGTIESLWPSVAQAPGIVILSGSQPWPAAWAGTAVTVPFAVQDFAGRRAAWRNHLAGTGISVADSDLDGLAGSFRFTQDQIANTVASTRQARIRANGATAAPPTVADLFASARAQSAGNMGSLARRVEPLYTWSDIVLPPDQIVQLREICSQARHRNVVFGTWGFDRKISYGKGLNVLFSGPPGTGKTMAAEIIANELQLWLYKIDLSQVVSKYIGETEKNLSRIFNEARMTNAIIFFDEADALFGKRSEVRDAHDRYANIEISYLLQKMEEYEGISILATNLRQNLDHAFARRLSISVDFPFPDEASRLRIWKSIWPQETPLTPNLDLRFVSAQYKLSGGSVKNVALAASFMAAEENAAVDTPHLLRAVRREFQKMGKSMHKTEFGEYASLVEVPA